MRNKMMRAALCAALTVLALTCVAFAATDGYTADRSGTVDYNVNTGKYTASYGSAEAGQEAVLLVVSGTESSYAISEKTIMYIDQKTVAGDGSVSFEFIPKSTPDSLVLLGVAGAPEPVLLGTVVGQGVTVSGTVNFQGSVTKATVKLTDAGGAEYTVETAKGGYEILGVPEGEYTLTITKKGHLPYSKAVTVSSDAADLGSVSLLGGDVDSDHRYINFSDVSALLADFKKDTAVNNATNINEDAFVNFTDLSTLLANFKKSY